MNDKELLEIVVTEIKASLPVCFGKTIHDTAIDVNDEMGECRGYIAIDSRRWDYTSFKFIRRTKEVFDDTLILIYHLPNDSRTLEEVRKEFVDEFISYAKNTGIVTFRKQYEDLQEQIKALAAETPFLTPGPDYLKQLLLHLAHAPGGSEYEKARNHFENLEFFVTLNDYLYLRHYKQ